MRDWFQFLQEQPSALSYSVFFWLRCLLWLAGFLIIFRCVLHAVRKKNSGALWNGKQKIIANANSIMSKASILILGILIGAGWTEYRIFADRYSYTDVLIVERYNDHGFYLQPARMQPFFMESCEHGLDWKVGEKMKHLKFQWRPECDSVGAKGDFDFYMDSNGKKTIYQQEISNARF